MQRVSYDLFILRRVVVLFMAATLLTVARWSSFEKVSKEKKYKIIMSTTKSVNDNNHIRNSDGAFSVIRGEVEFVETKEGVKGNFTILGVAIGGGFTIRITDWANTTLAGAEKGDRVEVACRFRTSKSKDGTHSYSNHDALEMRVLCKAGVVSKVRETTKLAANLKPESLDILNKTLEKYSPEAIEKAMKKDKRKRKRRGPVVIQEESDDEEPQSEVEGQQVAEEDSVSEPEI